MLNSKTYGVSKRTKQPNARKKKIAELVKNYDFSFAIPDAQLNLTNASDNAVIEAAVINDEYDYRDVLVDDQMDVHIEEPQPVVKNQGNIEIQIEIEEENFNTTNEESLMCASLLTVFFSGHLTQTALKLVIEHTQLFTANKLPKSFNQLILRVQNEKLEYEKIWFCQNCHLKIDLNDSKQRICLTCNQK